MVSDPRVMVELELELRPQDGILRSADGVRLSFVSPSKSIHNADKDKPFSRSLCQASSQDEMVAEAYLILCKNSLERIGGWRIIVDSSPRASSTAAIPSNRMVKRQLDLGLA